MTQIIKQIVMSAAILAGLVFFAGCAAHPQKIISASRYNFTFLDNNKDYIISNVYVSRKGNEYKIHGSIANRWSSDKINKGKVRVLFTDSDNTVLEEVFAPIYVEPSQDLICKPKPSERQSYFTASVEKELLDSSINIEYLKD